MERTTLDGPWTLEAVTGPAESEPFRSPTEAVVPGCVHTDLLRAGRIPDPFDGDGEAATQWIGDTVWRYRGPSRGTARAPTPRRHRPAERHDLVAEGLDTLATIELNGLVVGTTANQHRSYRFPVGHLLRPGDNELVITFDARSRPPSACPSSTAASSRTSTTTRTTRSARTRRTSAGTGASTSRRAASGARSASSRGAGVRIAAVRPSSTSTAPPGCSPRTSTSSTPAPAAASASTSAPHPRSRAREHRPGGTRITVSGHGASHTGSRPVTGGRAAGSAAVRLELPDVAVWWPRGHGEQPLYDVRVEVGDDVWTGRVGFRTVTLDTAADAGGATVPAPGERRARDRARRELDPGPRVPDRDDAGAVRRADRRRDRGERQPAPHSGGGIYESDDLYDRCDELGVLVWQDFLFACAAYAEEPWLADEVEPEVREAVTRLSPHPSLVVWNGNNENLVAYASGAGGRRSSGGPGATGTTGPCCPRSSPSSTRPAVHARLAVLVRRVPAPERRPQRHRAHLGRLEHEGLHRVRRLASPVRRRVRVPGAARLVDAHRRGARRAPRPGRPRDARAPEGARGQPEARRRHARAPARAAEHRGLALGGAAEPGARDPVRHGLVPVAHAPTTPAWWSGS